MTFFKRKTTPQEPTIEEIVEFVEKSLKTLNEDRDRLLDPLARFESLHFLEKTEKKHLEEKIKMLEKEIEEKEANEKDLKNVIEVLKITLAEKEKFLKQIEDELVEMENFFQKLRYNIFFYQNELKVFKIKAQAILEKQKVDNILRESKDKKVLEKIANFMIKIENQEN